MKILLATDTWAPMVNGVVRSVQLLRQQLLAMGHDVRVLTLSGTSRSYTEDGVVFLGSVSAGYVYPGARVGVHPASPLLRELEQWGPDVIHTQSEFSIFMLAHRLAKRCGCPLVHTYHTVYEDYTHYIVPSEKLGKSAVEYATRLVAGKCSVLLAPTDKVRRLLESYGVGCPVVTVPTGIDLTAFHPAEDDGAGRTELHRQLGLSGQERLLVSIGRLAAEKNHGELLRLLAQQPEQNRPHLAFVGDGPARPELEQQTRQLGLERFVNFVGMVPPDEVARWYQAGDAFVSASRSETQGLTSFEALACGIPALCRADPCLEGVIEDGVNGWQWHTDAEFASALDRLCSATDAQRAEWQQNALATAARYSAQNFARQVLKVYRQALNRQKPVVRRGLSVSGVATGAGFLLCVWLSVWAWQKGLFTDLAALQAWVGGLGWWAPAAFVTFQAVQVVIPVLPGGLGCLAGVILFGPWWGFVYNYLGICAGSLAAFGVARQCGRPLLTRMFPAALLEKYQRWTGEKSHFTRWFALAIFLPVAPDDFLCYLAGTTTMGWGIFTAIILLGKPFAIAMYSAGLTTAMHALLSF